MNNLTIMDKIFLTCILSMILFVILVTGSLASMLIPELSFWLSEEEIKIKWCETYRPELNQSLFSEDIRFCYNDYWNVYCRISQSSDCESNYNMTYQDAKDLFLGNKIAK